MIVLIMEKTCGHERYVSMLIKWDLAGCTVGKTSEGGL